MYAIQPQVKLDTFHRERSKFLDKFADVEQAVVLLLKVSGAKVGSECLGQKIETLRRILSQLKTAKPRFSAAISALDDLDNILPLRGDIVHSRLGIALVDGVTHAHFRNSRFSRDRSPPVRLLTLKDFQHLDETLAGIANRLSVPAPFNPASSPPPPSPGEAAVP